MSYDQDQAAAIRAVNENAENFSWDAPPKKLTFENTDKVEFKIESVETFKYQESGTFGITVECTVLRTERTEDRVGERISLQLGYKTKAGKQNWGTYRFLTAMFPDQVDGQFPIAFLAGRKFSAVSKRTPHPQGEEAYQNWESYRAITEDSQY